MKSFLPLLSFAIIFASCTTAYKVGQTPDDVYYSPTRPQDEYVRVERNDDRKYRYDEEEYDDRYLRMKIRNRQLWSELDRDWYYNNPYVYRNYNNWYYYNNAWNPRHTWNYYYNPYGYTNVIVINPKSPVYNKPRTSNLHVFDQYNSKNPKSSNGTSKDYNNASNRNYGTNTPSRNSGSDLRDIFGRGSSSSSSGSSNNNNSSSRTETNRPSSSSSSSSSGSSSSGGATNAPVRRN